MYDCHSRSSYDAPNSYFHLATSPSPLILSTTIYGLFTMCGCSITLESRVCCHLSGSFSWAFQAWLKVVGAIILSLEIVAWWWWLVVNEVDDEVMDERWDLPQTGVMSIIGNCRVLASADCWVMNGVTWLDCSTSLHSLFLMQLALSHTSHLPDVSNPTTCILECRKKGEDPLSCKFHANRACRERKHETWAVRIGGSLEVRPAQGGTIQGVNALHLKWYHHLQRWENPHPSHVSH